MNRKPFLHYVFVFTIALFDKCSLEEEEQQLVVGFLPVPHSPASHSFCTSRSKNLGQRTQKALKKTEIIFQIIRWNFRFAYLLK